MACGSCGQKRAKQASAADGRKTQYVVTWGDGTRTSFATNPAGRVAMANEKDPAKRRGMFMTAQRV